MSFTVRSVDGSFADALRWHLLPFHRSAPDQHAFLVDLFVQDEDERHVPRLFSLFIDGALRFRHTSLGAVLGHAVWELHAAVPQRTRDFVFLHAGAVVKDGGGLLLPAKMDSGKSSLVVALLERGWDYLSDELGALDPVTDRAYPFPKRIRLDEEALRFFGGLEARLSERREPPLAVSQRLIRPEDLGAGSAAPTRPRWLVFLNSNWEGPPRLETMPRAEAVERMAENCFNLHRYGERGVVLLSRIAREAKAFELHGGTPRDRAELLSASLR